MHDAHEDSPASIPVAALAFAGNIAPALGYFLGIEQAGVLALGALITSFAGFLVAIYLKRTTTSAASPVVASGTEVSIIGSAHTVTAEIPPKVDPA